MNFLDLKAQYKSIKKEVDQAIQGVLDNTSFILGEEVEKLEKEIAKYCGVRYAVGVNSGTDALLLSLMALDIKERDEVITTPFTFIATAEVIALLKAKPVFVDINPKTFNVDPTKIEEKITKKTKAIIPVHLFGQPADMGPIMKIARKYKLKVIEDAAQAIGAEYKGKKACFFSDTGCLSFFPSKNLGGYGDGGMVVTNSKKIADKVKMLRQHGSKIKYQNDVLGINSRLDTLQAAILRVKLKYLDRWAREKNKVAERYNKLLKGVGDIRTPYREKWAKHVYHQYTIRTKKRDKLAKYLKKQGIPTMVYYVKALHLQKAFKYLGYKKGNFPEAEKAAREVLSLPIYAELSGKDQDRIVRKIKNFSEVN